MHRHTAAKMAKDVTMEDESTHRQVSVDVATKLLILFQGYDNLVLCPTLIIEEKETRRSICSHVQFDGVGEV